MMVIPYTTKTAGPESQGVSLRDVRAPAGGLRGTHAHPKQPNTSWPTRIPRPAPHPAPRSPGIPLTCDVGLLALLAEPEVGHLAGGALLAEAHQQVAGLEVEVHDALQVQVLHALPDENGVNGADIRCASAQASARSA